MKRSSNTGLGTTGDESEVGDSSAPAYSTTLPRSLMDVAAVAKRLGTSERFVRRLVDERRVPFHKVGKFVRFDPRDIDAWLADNRVEAL